MFTVRELVPYSALYEAGFRFVVFYHLSDEGEAVSWRAF